MRTVLARAAVLAAALLVVLPMAASAAVDDYAAEASTTSVQLSAFENQVGSPILDLIGTDALTVADPTASASVSAIEVLGEQLFEVRSADSSGEPVRDPEEGDGCVLPVEVTGLTLRAVCAVAAADAGDVTETSASATTQLLDLGVNGSLLAGALTTPLGDFIDLAGETAISDAIDEFIAQCNAALAAADEQAQVTNTARELLAMAPEELDPVKQPVLDAAATADQDGFCSAVFNLTAGDLPAEVLDVAEIAAALEGLELVTLKIDGASSNIAGSDAALDAAARQVTMRISGLEDFAELDAVIVAVVEEIQAAIEDLAGGQGGELPLPEDFSLQGALDQIPLFGIEGPLVEGEINGGAATAALDVADATTTSGGTEPFVTLTLAPGLLELLGADPEMGTQTFTAGQSQTIAEGTPLESNIRVGTLTTEDGVTFEDTDLTGSTATASGTEVNLLTGVEGGITLVLSQSSAGAFGTASATPSAPAPDPGPMPHTGGGAAVAAVLALGAAVALRRRRD